MKIKMSFFLFLQVLLGISQNQNEYNNWSQSLDAGIQYLNIQSFNEAENQLASAYKFAQSLFAENSEELTTTAYYYALILVQVEQAKNAQEPMEKALAGFKFLYGESSEQYATGLSILANIYLSNKVYKLAKEKLLESIQVLKNMYGENHYMHGIALTNLAAYYREIENYKKALETINKGLTVLKDNPEFDQQYYNNLRYNNLPAIYQGLGKLEEALKMEEESLEFIRTSYGKFTSNYANILTSIGGININLGYFNKAEKALEEAAVIFEQLDDIENEEALGNVYMFLVACYTKVSDYKKAFYYASEGIRLTKLESANPPTNTLNYYEILGDLNWNLGNIEQSKEYLQKIIDATIESIGENAPQLPVLKSELGMCYRELDETDKAIKETREAFDMVKKMNYTIKDLEYRQCLDNLSAILIDQKKYKEAIINLETTLKEEDKSYPNYWIKATDLANVYLYNNQCSEATNLLEEAIEKIKQFYGKENPNYIGALNSLVIAQRCAKKYGLIIDNIKESNLLTKKQLLERFSFSTEALKREFLIQLEYSFDIFQSVNMDLKNNELSIINLENQFLLKGLLLNQSKNVTSKLIGLGDEGINAQIDDYINNKQHLNRLEDNKELYTDESLSNLQSQIDRSEIELVQLYNENFKKPIDFNKSWKKVQDKLEDNEMAIEFSRFNYITNKASDSIYYAAYLIKKGTKEPQLIKLFEEQQLSNLLKTSGPSQLYSSRGSKSSSNNSITKSNVLYNLIWKPIEQYLDNVKTIYFSPAGLLNNISFASLNDSGNLLINRYNLNQLSSTYKIVSDRVEPVPDNSLFLGGIDYEYSENSTDKANKISNTNDIDLITLNTKRGSSTKWDPLPGTLNEINNLKTLFKNKQKSHKVYTGKEATETAFKKLSGNSYNTIHIATHGYFFKKEFKQKEILSHTSVDNKFTTSDDPLKRAGLLFSGANYAWLNGNNPYEIDNGILTAKEIADLDLSNTDIVVLSACETGLGDIEGSEGVYGLQRAFKMAGVDIIIMSLWEVPDAETSEFMTIFYTNWLNGQEVRKAFRNTQITMAETYKWSPEKWAAFVLFE